jgi:hypothetical protein
MMTDEAKQTANAWITDLIKSVGFPIVVALALLWAGREQITISNARYDKQQDLFAQTISTQLAQSTAALTQSTTVMGAINETLKRTADEQRETRAVMRSVLAEMHGEEQSP